jgi:hypothetical protein
VQVAFHGSQQIRILLVSRQIDELPRVVDGAMYLLQVAYDPHQPGAALTQLLGTLRIFPDVGLLQLPLYLLELFLLAVVVKDTS